MRARPSTLLMLVLTACAPAPEPEFDDELGVQPVAVEPGALAGTFALFTRAVGPIDTVLGEQPSGNDDWLLVERTYDVDRDAYAQTSQLCGGVFLPVLEVQSVVPAPTWRLVPPSSESVTVAHDEGTYVMETHLQLWGLRDLDDPYGSPWPATRDEVDDEAFQAHVYDMDEDESPGVTILAEGLVEGEMYAAQRKTTSLDGVVVGLDRVVGRSTHLFEVVSLGATIPLLDQGPPQRNPTERAQSWFDEVRLPPGATCDDVDAMVARGELGERPF